jgi:hypothetical protein
VASSPTSSSASVSSDLSIITSSSTTTLSSTSSAPLPSSSVVSCPTVPVSVSMKDAVLSANALPSARVDFCAWTGPASTSAMSRITEEARPQETLSCYLVALTLHETAVFCARPLSTVWHRHTPPAPVNCL